MKNNFIEKEFKKARNIKELLGCSTIKEATQKIKEARKQLEKKGYCTIINVSKFLEGFEKIDEE